jgi:hypothetical protein
MILVQFHRRLGYNVHEKAVRIIMRAFWGIDFPNEIKNEIYEIQ